MLHRWTHGPAPTGVTVVLPALGEREDGLHEAAVAGDVAGGRGGVETEVKVPGISKNCHGLIAPS